MNDFKFKLHLVPGAGFGLIRVVYCCNIRSDQKNLRSKVPHHFRQRDRSSKEPMARVGQIQCPPRAARLTGSLWRPLSPGTTPCIVRNPYRRPTSGSMQSWWCALDMKRWRRGIQWLGWPLQHWQCRRQLARSRCHPSRQSYCQCYRQIPGRSN